MDERQFQNLFKQTLEEEIANVELWKQIEAKLPTPSSRTVKTGFRLGKSTAIVLMLTMTVIAAYAFYQEIFVPGDPGIAQMQEVELLTALGITQPIEEASGDHNLSVTLDYAYADANRITVSYTVRGESPDGRRMMAYSNPIVFINGEQALNRLPLVANQESQENASEGETDVFSNTITANFIADGIDLNDGDMLGLRLQAEVALSYLDEGEFPAPGMMLAGVTNFTFDVPFIGGNVIEVGQSVNMAEQTVDLERVVITPSMTRLDMCFTLPPVAEVPGWSPFISVTVGDEVVFTGQTATYGLDDVYNLNDPCQAILIPHPLHELVGDWSVEVIEFRDLGTFGSPVVGPWNFTFTVPEN